VAADHKVPPGIDASVASSARIYDYWLGGHNNFAVDRLAAQKMLEYWPTASLVARENRAFLGRAVRFLAEAGIRQFLDLGTGLPTGGSIHEIARAVVPDARVVYVDNDPMVLAHARALKTGDLATVIPADLRDVDGVLSHADTKRLIDLTQPLAVVFLSVLHFIADPEARNVVTRYLSVTGPGSYLVLTHATEEEVDPESAARGLAVYKRAGTTVFTRPRSEILQFFDGLEIVEPGLVPVQQWRPDQPGLDVSDLPAAARALLGAAARKPA
jgi:predicted O-methyltransferase YrrM